MEYGLSKDCGLLHEPITRCKDCGLLHEPWSDNTDIVNDTSSDAYSSSGSTEQELVKLDSPLLLRTVKLGTSRCQLRDLPMCSLSDNDISGSSSSGGFIDDDVEWNSFMIKAHSTNNLNWTSSQLEYHNQFNETSTVDVLHQPATLTSCALQVLDNAGHLDFNIQHPCSMEAALLRIGAVDQLPVCEVSVCQNKSQKRVSFYLPGDDVGLDGSNTSLLSSLSLSHKDCQVFFLKDVLNQVLASLSPIQTRAIDVLSDQRHILDNSMSLSSNETMGKAILNMSPLQSLAAAVQAGYVDTKTLPAVVDSDFIRENMKLRRA